MNKLSIFVILLLVSACMTPEERAKHEAERQARLEAMHAQQCIDMGFVSGSEAFAQCRLSLQIDHNETVRDSQPQRIYHYGFRNHHFHHRFNRGRGCVYNSYWDNLRC